MITPEYFMQQVEDLVCDYEQVKANTLYASTNKPESVLPRQIIFYLVRFLYRGVITLGQIGHRYGKDHATVIHGCRKVQDYCDVDKSFNSKIENYKTLIKELYMTNAFYAEACAEEIHLVN